MSHETKQPTDAATLDELARRIQALEERLNELSERDDYPTNPEVVTLTEELDDLVIQYYRLMSHDASREP